MPEVNKLTKAIESKNAETQTKEMNENLGSNISMQTLIRENSWLFCEHCEYKSESKKGLKMRIGKMYETLKNTTEEFDLKCDECYIMKEDKCYFMEEKKPLEKWKETCSHPFIFGQIQSF